MDIYDTGLLGTNARSGTATPDSAANKTELDQNVEKVVGNISSWWSGIAKKSQESINLARQQVESQGGIVNYAKSNYAKIESSISEAQKRAREQSTGETAVADPDSPGASVDKGKQRAIDEEAVPNAQGPTLGSSVSALFSKLTADPRLQQLQASLTSSMQAVANPQEQLNEDGTPRAPTPGNTLTIQESLAKLSLTFQSHLPHLDLKESQQLATKYLHATENFAKEIQSDMTELVGELVRIVPAEEESKDKTVESSFGAAVPVAAPSTDADTAAVIAAEEDDFVWDEEDEDPSVTASHSEADKTVSLPPAAPKDTTTEKGAETDEDSDWE